MKRNPWLKYLPVIVVSTCFAPVAHPLAYPAESVHIAQVGSDYDNYMRLGYAATGRRDYRNALVNFRHALSLRPGDRYATGAIRNVSSYIARGGESKLVFIPPNRGAPGNRQGGGTRGGCSSSNQALTALVPATNQGLTTAEYPVVFVYLPQTSAQTLEFALLDKDDNQIYKTNVAPTQTPGIISLNLSTFKGLPPLQLGKDYHWYFSIICNPQNRSADIAVDGWFQRIEPDPALASELKKTKPGDRVSLYAVNGIWYDALASLAETRQSSLNNSALANEWVDLLKSVGLEKIAREPLLQCCTVKN